MANANLYYQQSQFKTEDFTMSLNKRKWIDQDHLTPITAQSILDRMAKETPQLEPAAKRRQTKPLFRPWMEEDDKKKATDNKCQNITATVLNSKPNNISAFQPYNAYPKSHNESPVMQQPKRNRQHLIELIKNYNKEATHWLMMQQQYAYYQQYQAAVMTQNLYHANYLRQIQHINLQRQRQMFVFGHHQ